MKIPKSSLWLLQFFGWLFMAMALIDVVMHRIDTMTSVFIFFGLLSWAVFYCLQTLEKRLALLEQSLRAGEGE